MTLMTKREIKSLLEWAMNDGVPVDMPWNYIARYNAGSGLWHMEDMDEDDTYSFNGDMSYILDMYGDLWRFSEFHYKFLIDSIKENSSYETLGGTVFEYGKDGLIADDWFGVHHLNGYEDCKRFFEED